MLGWMVYAAVVALILAAAALAAERAAQMRKAPTRGLWAASMLASLTLPVVVASTAAPAGSRTAGGATAPMLVPPDARALDVLQPSAWVNAMGGASIEIIPSAKAMSLDAILQAAWGATSAAIVLAMALGAAQLHRRKRGWKLRLADGAPVYVSEDVGPAVVGLLRPSIVVPRWLADAPPETQALVLAHEQSHLEANDARLLALAVLALAAVPWNLPLWWQLRRLRFAIEVDCDSRVLKAGRDVSRYGETLIMVGERQSRRIAMAAAMSESRSFLEQRIRHMLWKPTKLAWASATVLAALGLVLAAAAAEVRPPPHAPEVGAPASPTGAPGAVIPARKPGWWTMRLTVQGSTPAPAAHQTVRICTDPAIDQIQTPFGVHTGKRCPPLRVSRTPNGWAFSESCALGATTVSTVGHATGDLASHYHVDLVTNIKPAPTPQVAKTRISIDATWRGQCPAGKKPGDMIMTMQTNVAPKPQ